MASDPGGPPHSRSGRRKEHPVLLCGPPSTALLLEAFLALGASAARRASLQGCGCPRGPHAGLPCVSGLNPEETRAAAFHTAGRPGAPTSCPAFHQGAAQPRSKAARQPSRGLLRFGRHFAPTRALEPDSSPSRPRLLPLLARLPPSPGKETSTRTVALRVTGCSFLACRPQDPHTPSREVTCPRRGAPPTGVNTEGWSSGHVAPRMQTRVHMHFSLLGNLPTFRGVVP